MNVTEENQENTFMLKRNIPNILLAILSFILFYYVAEYAYRVYYYSRMTKTDGFLLVPIKDKPLYIFDQAIGYRRSPYLDAEIKTFDGTGSLVRSSNIKTNNFGRFSPTDDQLLKPETEYRIAILGDSFTGGHLNAIPWPTALEGALNKNDGLKKSLGVASFKVLNFGMEATGFVQWESVYKYDVARFHPDLVLIDFITDDITRKFVWRDSLSLSSSNYSASLLCTSLPASLENRDCELSGMIFMNSNASGSAQERAGVLQELVSIELKRLPWLSPYPDLLARALGYRFGLKPIFSPYYQSHFNQEEGLAASQKALTTIVGTHPNLLVLHNPIYEELIAGKTPSIVLDLIKANPKLDIQLMSTDLPALDSVGRDEIRGWFNPDNGHFTPHGVDIYSRVVAQLIYARLLKR